MPNFFLNKLALTTCVAANCSIFAIEDAYLTQNNPKAVWQQLQTQLPPGVKITFQSIKEEKSDSVIKSFITNPSIFWESDGTSQELNLDGVLTVETSPKFDHIVFKSDSTIHIICKTGQEKAKHYTLTGDFSKEVEGDFSQLIGKQGQDLILKFIEVLDKSHIVIKKGVLSFLTPEPKEIMVLDDGEIDYTHTMASDKKSQNVTLKAKGLQEAIYNSDLSETIKNYSQFISFRIPTVGQTDSTVEIKGTLPSTEELRNLQDSITETLNLPATLWNLTSTFKSAVGSSDTKASFEIKHLADKQENIHVTANHYHDIKRDKLDSIRQDFIKGFEANALKIKNEERQLDSSSEKQERLDLLPTDETLYKVVKSPALMPFLNELPMQLTFDFNGLASYVSGKNFFAMLQDLKFNVTLSLLTPAKAGVHLGAAASLEQGWSVVIELFHKDIVLNGTVSAYNHLLDLASEIFPYVPPKVTQKKSDAIKALLLEFSDEPNKESQNLKITIKQAPNSGEVTVGTKPASQFTERLARIHSE